MPLFDFLIASFKSLKQTEIPYVNQYFDVNVTLAVNPNNFTIQPWEETMKFEKFHKKLNDFYSDPSNSDIRTIAEKDMENDIYYAGKYDGLWYRVKLNSYSYEKSAALMKLVDYGDIVMISLDNLQPLWPIFRETLNLFL